MSLHRYSFRQLLLVAFLLIATLLSVASLRGLFQNPEWKFVQEGPTWRGKRGNPVLWPRTHFARLAALDGDVGGKALLAEFAEHVIEVAVESDGILADIDTPDALAAARQRQGN